MNLNHRQCHLGIPVFPTPIPSAKNICLILPQIDLLLDQSMLADNKGVIWM